MELYEQKKYHDSELKSRALNEKMPGRAPVMCCLADTLYGRAATLHTTAALTPQRPRPTGRAPLTSAALQRLLLPRGDTDDVDPEAEAEEEGDENFAPSYSPPLSPPAGSAVAAHNAMAREAALRQRQRQEQQQVADRQMDFVGLNQPDGPLEEEDEADRVEAEDDASRAREDTFDGEKLEALQRKLMSEAKALYEEAYRIDPHCSYAVNGLSLFLVTRAEKRQMLELAVQIDDRNPYALANLGGELLGEDDQRALDCLNRALLLNPKLFYARLCKSKVLLQLGDLAGAVEAARQQVEWQPDDEMATRFLAQLEFRMLALRNRMLHV
ncbi:unnamed protein product [Polarella glacialis]|uniref:Uncharacterized protein n=1 Tax=Polarella glacialis TaxID=89957 RepID=A0A813G111_POLGL|nr:unnamed protein product [Polarella glacialis]